jgi:hypothetical protein
MDVMAVLRDRRVKAEAKVRRAAKALEIAQKELTDVVAAERVMADITGESPDQRSGGGGVSDRDGEIAKLLGVGPTEANSPAELHPVYVRATGDTPNLDVFRTALWRLQKKAVRVGDKAWSVKSENGRYWREIADSISDDFDTLLRDVSDDEPETN